LFSIIYIYIVIPYFSYEKYYYIDISEEKIILSIFFLFLFSLILEKKEKISVALINALIGFSIIPMLVLFSFQNLSSEYMLYATISVILIMLICRIRFNFGVITLNIRYISIAVFVISFFILLFLFLINYKYFNLNIIKIYEFRGLISENTPVWITYLYNILFKGLLPLLFLYYLFHLESKLQKFILSFFLIIFYTLIFGITSHKFFLFIIPALIFIYLIINFLKDLKLFFIKIVIFILVLFIIFFIFIPNSEFYLLMSSLFIRREFFVPAMVNFSYFEFFKNHNFVYFTDSNFLPFKFILGYPYDLDISHLIGREMFGKPEMGANTGWLGSGYAHLGFVGMLIYAFIISILLKYLDYVSRYLKKKFILVSFFPFINTLFLSSDLKTVFVTHGLAFYIILIGVFAYNQKKERIKLIFNDKI